MSFYNINFLESVVEFLCKKDKDGKNFFDNALDYLTKKEKEQKINDDCGSLIYYAFHTNNNSLFNIINEIFPLPDNIRMKICLLNGNERNQLRTAIIDVLSAKYPSYS